MAEVATAIAEQAKRQPVLTADRFKLAEYERNNWIANVEPGITTDDCLKAEFWTHIAEQLRPYDHIEVRAEDGTWVAEFLVLRAERMWAATQLMWKAELSNLEHAIEKQSRYEPIWKGPQLLWCVRRKSDGELLRKGLRSKDEAIIATRELEGLT